MQLSEYEREREANIARNRALLEELELKQAIDGLGLPTKKVQSKPHAKPIQPSKRPKREKVEDPVPRRQSARLKKDVIDPNETPSQKRKREAEDAERKAIEAEEKLETEARDRAAKRPRHHDLHLAELVEDTEQEELSGLTTTLQTAQSQAKRVGEPDSFLFDTDKKDRVAVEELRENLQKMKIVARAKVTTNRVYSAAFHPEVTKDLIFFGDKHGQLGIWDARASPDEVADEDDEVVSPEDQEGGKYWRLQPHWPASPKSSISCIKLDPTNSHNVYTSAYDCTIRSLSFPSGVSSEVYSTDNVLISSIDLPPSGREMWISDTEGGVTHLDLREHKSKARRYTLSDQKIGSLSINPVHPTVLLTASNDRVLKIWDTRILQAIGGSQPDVAPLTPPPSSPGPEEATQSPREFGSEDVQSFMESKRGKGSLRGEWRHEKSVSSAYWDPWGRSIVSTSYDNSLRLWDIGGLPFKGTDPLRSFRPFARVSHNCQTGKWLTILRAQWTPNPDVYPHFTIGNMDHSLDIFSCKGDVIARLSDRSKITAVQAVTCSHPNIVERAASGNASGRCVLWAPE